MTPRSYDSTTGPESSGRGEFAETRFRGYRADVKQLVRRINPVTLVLWVLAAGMAALLVGEYVSQRM